MVRHLFVLGLNDFNQAKLAALPEASECRFHKLLTPEDFLDAAGFPIGALLDRARATLRAFPEAIDALIAYMDFPASTMVPVLSQEFGLPAPSLESLLKCEHKYWSRLEQQRLIPEHVPAFRLVDPFVDPPRLPAGSRFPFWLKPVKSFGSHLGFRVRNNAEYRTALAEIRAALPRLAEPFSAFLKHAALPPEVAHVDGHACLAEQLLKGHQCTLEGAVHRKRCYIHGVIDSIRYPRSSSFLRYEYPSRLPVGVRRRMAAVLRRFLHGIGYDGGAFNAEFFWDPPRDRIWLLEVNTRIAQHHSDLFEKVDGCSNHRIPVQLGLGRAPRMPRRKGPFRCAAAFFLRRFHGGTVTATPTPEALEALQRAIPGTIIQPQVVTGTTLSDLVEQDSYSYLLAIIYLGGHNRRELLRHYRQIVPVLDFRFA